MYAIGAPETACQLEECRGQIRTRTATGLRTRKAGINKDIARYLPIGHAAIDSPIWGINQPRRDDFGSACEARSVGNRYVCDHV